MIFILAFIVALALAFYIGAIYGINDCKTRFRIPKGVVEVYEVAPNLFTYWKEESEAEYI